MVALEREQLVIQQNDETHVQLNAGTISRMPLTNFADTYKELGGRKLNNELVNMLIRRVDVDMQKRPEILPCSAAFQLVCYLLKQYCSDLQDKELWRIANTYTHYQYQYHTSYLNWQWKKLTQPLMAD